MLFNSQRDLALLKILCEKITHYRNRIIVITENITFVFNRLMTYVVLNNTKLEFILN